MDCLIVTLPEGLPEKFDLGDLSETPIFDVDRTLQLIAEAKPWVPKQPPPRDGNTRADTAPDGGGELQRDEAMLRFLIGIGALCLDGRGEWILLGMALKASRGDAGLKLWDLLSSEADGYEPDKIGKEWQSFGKRPADQPSITIATYYARAKGLGYNPTRGTAKRSGESAGSGGPGKNEDFAAFTVHLVEEARDEFWVDQEAKPHVTHVCSLPDGSTVKLHLPVRGSAYREVLQERFFDAANGLKTLKVEQADGAAAILAMRAKKTGVRHQVKLRVGEHNGCIYVDLGTPDGAAIEVDGAGWRRVLDPPVRFIRGSRGEFPVPEPGGTLADFERHFNLSLDDLRRVIGFMIGVYNVDGSFPILMTDGEQGSCKSTLNDKVLGVTDPPHQAKSARMSFNPKEQDLHILAQGVHVLSFDNVSTLNADEADILCRITTGGASGSRELYSNDRFNQFVVMRSVILTCIGVPSVRPDFLDRSIQITAQPVARRLTERAVQAAFERDRPRLLGFLFSCVSAALKNRKLVAGAIEDGSLQLPRMADFAAFVEGAHELLGLKLGGFSALLQAGQSAMQIESVTGDPVGAGLLRHFSYPSSAPLTASASDLLRLLKEADPQEHRWPAANGLSKRLKRIAVGLRHLGIQFEITEASGHDNVAKYRVWTTSSFQPLAGLEDHLDDGGGHF